MSIIKGQTRDTGPVEKPRQPVLTLPAVAWAGLSNGFIVLLLIDSLPFSSRTLFSAKLVLWVYAAGAPCGAIRKN